MAPTALKMRKIGIIVTPLSTEARRSTAYATPFKVSSLAKWQAE